jgi:hypothetical protein
MFSNLFEHDIAALRPERNPHGIREDVDAAQHAIARVDGKFDVFGSHRGSLKGIG